MDECRKAMARVELGMRTIQVVIGERRLSVGIDSEAERFANDLAAAWNRRTEAKVSGEVVPGAWYFATVARIESFLDSEKFPTDKREMVWRGMAGDSWFDLRHCQVDARGPFVGPITEEALRLPAPQSPVVPGVEEVLGAMGIGTARWRDESWDNPAKKEYQFQAEAIHAHLLANARESREKQKQELENCSNLLSLAVDFIRDKYKSYSSLQEIADGIEEVMEALATVGKEG